LPSRISIGDLVKANDPDFFSELGLVVATGEEQRPWFGGGHQISQFFSVLWQDPLHEGPAIRKYTIDCLTTGYIKIVGRAK